MTAPWPSWYNPPGRPLPKRAFRSRVIATAVADLFGYTLEDLQDPSKEAERVRARAVVYAVLKRHGVTFPAMGRLLNRHHASALNAVHNLPVYIEEVPELAQLLDAALIMFPVPDRR